MRLDVWRGIVLRIAGMTVQRRRGRWYGDNAAFVRGLNAGFNQGTLPIGYYPDRERAVAEHAARTLGGRILADRRPPPRPSPPNAIY